MRQLLFIVVIGCALLSFVSANHYSFWGREGYYPYRDLASYHRLSIAPTFWPSWPTLYTPFPDHRPFPMAPYYLPITAYFPDYRVRQVFDLDRNEVVMQNTMFTPGTVRIKLGESVIWKNRDGAKHAVVSAINAAESFDSSPLSPGASFSATFNKEGTFDYYCPFHPWMRGRVVVSS